MYKNEREAFVDELLYRWLICGVLFLSFRFHKKAAKFGALRFMLQGVIKKSELETKTELKKNDVVLTTDPGVLAMLGNQHITHFQLLKIEFDLKS